MFALFEQQVAVEDSLQRSVAADASVEKYAKLGSAAIRAALERLHKQGRGEE